jgi:cell wall-associated NlpC family hydrolase
MRFRFRLAAFAATVACASAPAPSASASGPVFRVVSDGLAPAPVATATVPEISFSAFAQLMGTDLIAATALRRETLGAQAVSIALRYIGVPYVWGGETPSGFDCSGLAMYVYGLLGIPMAHYTGAQFKIGQRVELSDLQSGDLLFFSPYTNGDPGHEGIYVGNGLMVHAPHTGDIVRVSPLDAERMSGYMGAVRPY